MRADVVLNVRVVQRAATRRTRRGQGRVEDRIDASRHGPRAVTPVRRSGAPTRRPAGPWRWDLANGAACRKPARRAASS